MEGYILKLGTLYINEMNDEVALNIRNDRIYAGIYLIDSSKEIEAALI